MATKKYVEGGITYENRDGQVYKNGRAITGDSLKYIPTVVGGTRDGAPSTSPTFRDVIEGQGGTVGYDSNTKQVTGTLNGQTINFTSGQGQDYGLGGLVGGQNTVSDVNKLLSNFQNIQPQVQQQAYAPMATQQIQQDPLQYMRDYYSNLEDSNRLNLLNALNSQTSALERQRAGITQQANQQRTNADTAAQLDALRLREVLANMGQLSAGKNLTMQGRIGGNLQQALSTIGQTESGLQNDISQRQADLRVANAGDIASMQAALAAEQARAMWDQSNADRSFKYQVGRDQIGDQRYNQEWAWQLNPNNPAYQNQVLQNQLASLQLQNLPQEQQLELALMRQQLANGQLDYRTAQEKLSQLQSGGGLSVSEQNALNKQKAEQYQAQADDIKLDVDRIVGTREKFASPLVPFATETRNYRKAIMQYLNSLTGVDPAVIDLIRQSYGISEAEALELLGG